MALILTPSRRWRIPVPKGLILPFDSSGSVPTGWPQWTLANAKYLVGAGNGYSIGATGGQTTIALNMTLDNAGSHGGSPNFNQDRYGSDAGYPGANTVGNHQHTIVNASAAYAVPAEEFKLVQAAADFNEIPINCLVLATGALAGLTNVTAYNTRLLKGGTTLAAVGSNTIAAQTLSTVGNHYHGGTGNQRAGSGAYNIASTGAHGGTCDVTITPKVKRKLLSAWKNASAAFRPMTGIIGMWLSLYPPPGWEICNGGKGTPDLRDYFIEFVTTGSENTVGTGTNVVDAAVSFTHGASHTHQNASGYQATIAGLHGTYAWSHDHTGSQLGIAYVPNYYGIVFIQKKI